MTDLLEDEWIADVSKMIAVWFVATGFAAALLLFVGFWA
jgi:hypothetical protein